MKKMKIVSLIMLTLSTLQASDATTTTTDASSSSTTPVAATANLINAIQNLINSTNFSSLMPQHLYITNDDGQKILNTPVLKKATIHLILCGLIAYFQKEILASPLLGTSLTSGCNKMGINGTDALTTLALLCAIETVIPLFVKNPKMLQEQLIAGFIGALATPQVINPKTFSNDECSKALWRALCGLIACTNLGTFLKNPNLATVVHDLAAESATVKKTSPTVKTTKIR